MSEDTNSTMETAPILSAENLAYGIGDNKIVDEVSVNAMPGELVGLIGPNGAGKSTLLSMLAGLRTPNTGNVRIKAKPLQQLTQSERAQTIGWLEQIGEIHWPLTVHRLVSLGRFPHLSTWQKNSAKDEQAIQRALAHTDSTHLQERNAMTLSGGERSRVLMARVLAAEPSLLLADEPVAALDLGHQLQTMDVLRNFARGDNTCVVVLHDLSVAARYCDKLYLMDQGKIAAQGNAATVLSNDNIRRVYGVDVIAGCESIPWIVPHKIVSKDIVSKDEK